MAGKKRAKVRIGTMVRNQARTNYGIVQSIRSSH